MNHVFGSQNFSDSDPNQNMVQMNSLFLSLMSPVATTDCESFAFKRHFGDFYLKARFSIENTFDKFISTAPIELRPSHGFDRFIATTPYTDTMHLRAEIPEGLRVTFLEYLDVMIPAQQRANDVLEFVLKPFEKFVGRLISDEVFRNQSGQHIKEFKDLEAGYKKTIEAMGKCFGKNDYKASAPFSEVVKRNGDWRNVFAKTGELRTLYQAFPQKDITSRLNVLYESLDALVEQIQRDQYARVEADVTKEISAGMYHIAKEIELAGLTTFRSKTFITAINTTLLNMDEIAQKA
jgi:hypothetical protein